MKAVIFKAPNEMVVEEREKPFGLSCGKCINCKAGRFTNCLRSAWLSSGQSEYAYSAATS